MNFTCHVCGNDTAHAERVSEVFQINGNPVLVENIPVLVCDRCGEVLFDGKTMERIRKTVRGSAPPTRTQQMAVFDYA